MTVRQENAVRRITLTRGRFALVDESDYDWLVQLCSWRVVVGKSGIAHAVSSFDSYMHRVILDPLDANVQVDHRNHNGLDNRRSNLRVATRSQNNANERNIRPHSSVYRGVSWHKTRQVWRASLGFDGRLLHLGEFVDEAEAAKAYDEKAKELYGEFANTNF